MRVRSKNITYWLLTILIVGLFFACKTPEFISSTIKTKEYESINDLISSMTLEEKVGQTCQITLDVLLKTDEKEAPLIPAIIDTNKLNEAIYKFKVGSVLNVGSHTFSLEEWKGILNSIHAPFLKGKTNVPIIYGIDAIHGMNYTIGATLFPQEIGLAATWNPELAKEFGEITAYETRASGIPWNFSPVLDLGRQPLWSRNFETLGEDPYLASIMGAAIIDGYQGGKNPDQFHVASCMKHFVGYSASLSGRDRTPAWIPDKYMQELYFPSFKKAVEHGSLTVMINSGAVNGIPGHLNHKLITETLKNKWGFEGFAVSDWEDFIMVHSVHNTAPTLEEAYIQSFNAGVDMSMVPLSPQYKEYCKIIIQAVKNGRISEDRLNDAVRRILLVKSRLELFKNPLPDLTQYKKFGSQEFKNKAKEIALESITLLKNENKTLPLTRDQKVLIAGPTSNNLIFLNGAWTHTWQGIDSSYNTKNCLTIKDAFEKEIVQSNCSYSQGAELFLDNDFEKTRYKNLEDYKQKVKSADVVVLCLGELPSTEKPGDIHSLNLSNEQMELARIASAEKKKLVLVLLEARPRIIHDIVDDANAIIHAYLPGDYGADALVDLIYGKSNFSGKLPYTYPKYDGVIEFYDHPKSVDRDKSGQFKAYDPEWNFGFGLNYSKVVYEKLMINKEVLIGNDSLEITVSLSNQNDHPCKEVVQLYISDDYASVIPSGKSLKDFQKIYIPANGNATCQFKISKNDLKFIGMDGDFTVENGRFTIRIGELEKKFEYLLNK